MGLSRSGYYYEPVPEGEENLALMRRLDELNLAHPVYGSRRLAALLFRNTYVPGTTLNMAGQNVGLLEFEGYFNNDLTAYESEFGLLVSVCSSA